ncbi:Set6p [Saccharomyces eubayanus]|uniref:Set6p n=1 Tax=Saccharomyces eubayanus TaxID=1080349 RepID=UPI0006C44F10|nr:SET6-like protein [Saccharomyces eubayanus]KOG96153.1 SET6-like protein [Saccharomyces eubayanus]
MTIDEDVREISPYFQVRQTTWGGRACFSSSNIPEGTTVLQAAHFTGSSISYEFRKEVCHNCFAYDNARTMKYKLNYDSIKNLICGAGCQINPQKFLGAGLWFCSECCRDSYLQIPNIVELIEFYEILLRHFPNMLKRYNTTTEQETKLNTVSISESIIQSAWDEIENDWIPSIDNMKGTKKINQLPPISEDEYCCIRFVCESLFNLKHMDPQSITQRTFNMLQSNELGKISRFPVLLHFQKLVFQTLYILLPSHLHKMLTIPLLRHILGTEYGNAFGIWQDGEAAESREYFGYWVFPEASYFNHSCNPNVTKYRKGNSMVFKVNKDIKENEQICIDYSGVLAVPTKKRRKFLADSWFFDCACERCNSELQSVH